jgi:hypothetical protein
MPNFNQRMSFSCKELAVPKGVICPIAFTFLPYICPAKPFPTQVARNAIDGQITSHEDFSTAALLATKTAVEFQWISALPATPIRARRLIRTGESPRAEFVTPIAPGELLPQR